jgi:hypothetical protein
MKVRNSVAFICLAAVAGSLAHVQKLTAPRFRSRPIPRALRAKSFPSKWQN